MGALFADFVPGAKARTESAWPSMAPLPRPAHAQVDQALLALASALDIDLAGDQPAAEQPTAP